MSSSVPTRREWILIGGGVAIALAFALVTRHAWEDYYITYRSSRNLANGLGLVFQPGERVHTFTSPIGVLLPALLSALTPSDDMALWLFRILSASLFVGTGIAIVRGQRALGVGAGATAFTLFLAATETKIVDFSINGQESAFLVFCLCASWACLAAGERCRTLTLAAIWAGLQYTRPDGFVYGGALALGFLLFVERGRDGRVKALLRMARAAGLALLFYAPWLLWTSWYYGSPIPHTIIAKQADAPQHTLGALARGLVSLFDLHTGAILAFGPTYVGFGGWPVGVTVIAGFIGTAVALYWWLPFAGRHARATSFAFFVALFYLTRVVVPSPWYLPAAAILGILTLGLIGHDVTRLCAILVARGQAVRARWLERLAAAAAFGVAAFTVSVLAMSAYQLRIQQREIEWGNRRALGLWLRRESRAGDRVLLEPLGYIGFYSGLKMLDMPGLSSPEVVAVRRKRGTSDWGVIIEQLKPEWLVLRPVEARRVFRGHPLLGRAYRNAATFDATARLDAYGWIPGRGYLDVDSRFLVLRRTSPIVAE